MLSDLLIIDLPGELHPPPEALDLCPDIGGCGLALHTAALVLTGDPAAALAHAATCPPCRVALDGIGAMLTAANMETPHAAELGGIAA
jgi:hypothetical protein